MNKLFAIAWAASMIFIAARVQAEVVAGWDFSQFKTPGALTGGSNPLPANYASQDPNGAGAGAAAFGSMSWTGTLLPTAGEGRNDGPEGPITSNESDDFDLGQPSFGAQSILRDEGQAFAHEYAMVAASATTIILTVTPPAGGLGGWTVNFGGKVQGGGGPNGGPLSCDPVGGPFTCGSTVTVEHAPDCTTYTSYASQALTLTDQRFGVALGSATDTTPLCVRLGLSATSGEPVLDNLTVVPEPGATVQVLAGLMGLAGVAWLRSRKIG